MYWTAWKNIIPRAVRAIYWEFLSRTTFSTFAIVACSGRRHCCVLNIERRRYTVYFSFDSCDISKVARSKYRISQRKYNERSEERREKSMRKSEGRDAVSLPWRAMILSRLQAIVARGLPAISRFPSRTVTSACRRELSEVDICLRVSLCVG